MKRNKLLCLLLTLVFVTGLMPVTATFAISGEEYPSIFEDAERNRMSDEEFFGIWDAETNDWKVETVTDEDGKESTIVWNGKINYDYSKDLTDTFNYVKAGDYYNARVALMVYYKNRNLKYPVATSRNQAGAELLDNNVHYSEITPIVNFKMKTEPQFYEFDVSSIVSGGNNAFMLASIKRDGKVGTESIASFNSKESGVNVPTLTVTQGKTTTELKVEQDMYVRAGVKYQTKNFGLEPTLEVSEAAPASDSVVYDAGTRISYFRFDLNQLPSDEAVTRATLKLYGSCTEEDKEIALLQTPEKSWKEANDNFNSVALRLLNYNGIEGGYNWNRALQPGATHGQYWNVQTRLWTLNTLFAEYNATGDEYWAKRGIEMYLDFIGDHGGILYGGNGHQLDEKLNAAFRGNAYSIQGFFSALKSNVIDGAAFSSLIKFMYQEPSGLVFPDEANWDRLNKNGLAFQLASILYYCAYFPEFRERDYWLERSEERAHHFLEMSFNDDGSYNESTSGYDISVLGSMAEMFNTAEIGNFEMSEEFTQIFAEFAKSQMNLAKPNGAQFQWGDGGANGNIRSIIAKAADLLDDPYLTYYGSNGADGTVPPYTSFVHKTGALGMMRSGWDTQATEMFLINRQGGNHSHNHTGAVALYAYGRDLLVDTGTSSYDGRDSAVAWQGGKTESHNTIDIDNLAQVKPASPILNDTDMYINKQIDFWTGKANAYDKTPQERNVLYLKNRNFFVVSDYLVDETGKGQPRTYTQNWHMPSDAVDTYVDGELVKAYGPTMDETTGISKTNYPTGGNLLIIPTAVDKLDSMGLKLNPLNRKHTFYSKQSSDTAAFNTILYPYQGNTAPNIKLTDLALNDVTDDSASAFQLDYDDGATGLVYFNHDDTASRRVGIYDTDASSIYVEQNYNGATTLYTATDFKTLNKNSEPMLTANRKMTDVSVSISGTTAEVVTSDNFDMDHDYLLIYAPNVNEVKFNDDPIKYAKIGDNILIGSYSVDLVPKHNPDGSSYATLPEININYPLELEDDLIYVNFYLPAGTTLTADKGWDGKLLISRLIETDKSWAGVIKMDGYTTDKTLQVTIPDKYNFELEQLINGKHVAPTVAVSSAEDAEAQLSTDELGYNGSTIYSKNLSNIYLTADMTPVEPGPDKKPSGSGGGSSGHVTVPATPTPSATPSASPSATPSSTPSGELADIEGHWAKDDIQEMYDRGYVTGIGENQFAPDLAITRGQFAAIITRMLKLPKASYEGIFNDVAENSWYAIPIEAAARAGILNGVGNGAFDPDRAITRGQMAKILTNAYQYAGGPSTDLKDITFTDSGQFADWEIPGIIQANTLGLMTGRDDGSFDNLASATRAEATVTLKRLLDLIEK